MAFFFFLQTCFAFLLLILFSFCLPEGEFFLSSFGIRWSLKRILHVSFFYRTRDNSSHDASFSCHCFDPFFLPSWLFRLVGALRGPVQIVVPMSTVSSGHFLDNARGTCSAVGQDALVTFFFSFFLLNLYPQVLRSTHLKHKVPAYVYLTSRKWQLSIPYYYFFPLLFPCKPHVRRFRSPTPVR